MECCNQSRATNPEQHHNKLHDPADMECCNCSTRSVLHSIRTRVSTGYMTVLQLHHAKPTIEKASVMLQSCEGCLVAKQAHQQGPCHERKYSLRETNPDAAKGQCCCRPDMSGTVDRTRLCWMRPSLAAFCCATPVREVIVCCQLPR